jgi:hypothetical protein
MPSNFLRVLPVDKWHSRKNETRLLPGADQPVMSDRIPDPGSWLWLAGADRAGIRRSLFSPETAWPDDGSEEAPMALGGALVLTGDHDTSSGFPCLHTDFLVHGPGALAGEMRVLSGYRPEASRDYCR